ncbi:transcriptional regulator [Clostridium zeae]|uniref:Transcriptional regulator n=1 Tax=Clostridium zeae TaxID=2759022 RepID=A0ABQ1ECZ4_9CLOT|nr:BlaI/MecI/CopY family transcriptional regulator [Clostridium zeae]GFZ32619.1 transcriptional regulator [Clostridium zeae]
MKNSPKITESEWLIMKVLWKKHPLTSTEVIDSLKEDSTWSTTTIHTFISRLVKKGAVGVIKESKVYKYYPIILEEQFREEETKTLINKIYDGSQKLFLKYFINDIDLTNEDIEDLKKMLEEKQN